ncbi:MAG TPA: aspartate-semialdehyde dehydrogenase [Leptospiraceae bacterium]|nr:aspartate-semialdehyde dehydrogenase [Leptospirales bacterium]HMU82424.1 aspartate-semialdehyde dehydrogenase [Leptospiraceae bacterium]HMW59780.1 aspartate-semialdehyde dehydrogenase [Leptospiraceae bacterium]HMX57838.1 aspartate-semialdehyde dehydrogenase [Leptospiraceae bacterium]HNE25113.1 aspartate-semialdehyde dehydrogenase [Leptospiraceae bacterium]
MKHIAIVGATGAVGQEMIHVLEKRNFPVSKLTLLASKRSAGKTMTFRGQAVVVQELTEQSFAGVDIALFSAGATMSKQFAPAAVKAGAVVVDNSSAFRMDPGTPLVVPEINPEDIKLHKGVIANPNCCAIILLMAVYPIHKINPIKRIIVSTYQSASGAGAKAMEELKKQAADVLAGRAPVPEVFQFPIAFNVFSHNAGMDLESGYNGEELKVIEECRKILHSDIPISPTCIRVSTMRAHAESVHLELTSSADLDAIRNAISSSPGVRLQDDRKNNHFPMPLEASGQDDVLVGRIRKDIGSTSGKEIDLFCCGDQLLKGAALNAVQIAEKLS